jgi:hypothetical protein
MSTGRLIILPHKSWHVWNRDNIEKVKRDERLHREAGEAKAEKERQVALANITLLCHAPFSYASQS